jgi:hypothetical protein
MTPNLKFPMNYVLIFIFLYLSWDAFKFYLILATRSPISSSNFGPRVIMFLGLCQLIGVLHILPYKASNGLMMQYAHCCMQTPPSGDNTPT